MKILPDLCINVVSVRNVAVDMIRLLKQPAKMNYLHRGLKIKTINLQKQYCLRKYLRYGPLGGLSRQVGGLL